MKVNKEEFEVLLKNHDWYYHNSDSMKVFDKGDREHKTIMYLMKDNAEFKSLYEEYKAKFQV
jgi:hypothetical protein